MMKMMMDTHTTGADEDDEDDDGYSHNRSR